MRPTDLYMNRLPWHGFGTDDLTTGLRMLAAKDLAARAYAQFNPRHSIGWLVYDLDSDTAMLDWDDRGAPAPNIIGINRTTGHAHLFYALEVPVHAYDGASLRALRYVAEIDLALTEKLGADAGYAKLIAKNPTNDRWLTFELRADPYDLEELADWLDLTKYRDRRRRLPTTGLGRNCTLFETLRQWAYRERRKPQGYLSEELFHEAVRWRALALNADFTPPLPHSEIRATAKSVAKWTWRRLSAEGFRAWQRERSKLATIERRKRARHNHYLILETIKQCPGLTRDEIAALCGVSPRTVYYALRGSALAVKGSIRGSQDPLSDMDDCSPGSAAGRAADAS